MSSVWRDYVALGTFRSLRAGRGEPMGCEAAVVVGAPYDRCGMAVRITPTEQGSKAESRAAGMAEARAADSRTLSGEPIAELYTEADIGPGARPPGGPEDPIGRPGEYPFTRGVYGSMYRGRLWT